ncbi:nuclear transport factor 2 family protein [Sinorhizobium mexicanum]|uniref:Nuclear transport factor 2 family protein n=1 Tax=Sinorhizobium mexicanum TaxID=375549 RepID=A0A859QRT2_9HYPH|nr:nuclear transport factor 2 family protein [Sinorhizobium mexicanum]MBP1882484.1 hypothetical protein [Sinorhizobium mexicanum]QLL62169.1 nuclear transport factor 2 family protein [Sinorhizobium mexicanum]
MNLPHSIESYFAADQGKAGMAPAGIFATDATVVDEGMSHVGPEAIATWWKRAKEQYEHTAEPLHVVTSDEVTIVRARVTGQFPGSPAVLTYRFNLQDDQKIARLEIGA